jgi:DNA-directed RNA polymerase subunit E'/Rpb7
VQLGTSAHKEGVVVVVGTAEIKIPSHKKMSRAESSEEKERWYTVKLFGMKSLTEEAMRRAAESRNI